MGVSRVNIGDVGKKVTVKVLMAVKAPDGKRLFLFDDLKGGRLEGVNAQMLRDFMERHRGK